MIDELDLLKEHIDGLVGPSPQVGGAREQLLRAIEESSSPVSPDQPHRRSQTRRRVTEWTLVAAAVVIAVVAVLALGGGRPSTPKRSVPPPFPSTLPAPAQLRLLADRVADGSIEAVGQDQLLLTQSLLSVAAQVNNGQAGATVEIAVKKWSDSSGLSCVSITTQPAQFASAQDQVAWTGLGLLVTPEPQPITDCSGPGTGDSPPDTITGSSQLIDVSGLPTDPQALMQQLQAGKTGIPAVDDMLPDIANPDIAFQRAALLLVGPTVGATPQFQSALYQAIALLPGVTSLGTTTTHNGQTGVGFAVPSPNGQSAIVVDPKTGALIEIRNLEDSSALTSLAERYVGSMSAMRVTSYSTQLQWFDPVGQPALVPKAELPSDVPVSIYAVAKPGVSNQMFAFGESLDRQYGGPSAGGSGSGEGAESPGSPATIEWSFVGNDAQFRQYLAAAKASGLFTEVDVI
jgi:hypothetical protein